MNVNNFDRQCLGGNLELSHLETDLEFKLFNYINSSYDSYSLFLHIYLSKIVHLSIWIKIIG